MLLPFEYAASVGEATTRNAATKAAAAARRRAIRISGGASSTIVITSGGSAIMMSLRKPSPRPSTAPMSAAVHTHERSDPARRTRRPIARIAASRNGALAKSRR